VPISRDFSNESMTIGWYHHTPRGYPSWSIVYSDAVLREGEGVYIPSPLCTLMHTHAGFRAAIYMPGGLGLGASARLGAWGPGLPVSEHHVPGQRASAAHSLTGRGWGDVARECVCIVISHSTIFALIERVSALCSFYAVATLESKDEGVGPPPAG
jgi:hypothetical protein